MGKLRDFFKRNFVDNYENLFGPEAPSVNEAVKVLEQDCSVVGLFYERGFISKEQAHDYALQHCRQDNLMASKYLNAGLISIQEAKLFILNGCEM